MCARSELARMFVHCDIFISGGGKSELPQEGIHSARRWTLPIAGKLQEPPFKGRPKTNPLRRWADLVSPQASRQRGHPPLPGGDCRAARPSQWSARSRLPNRKRTFGGTAPKRMPDEPCRPPTVPDEPCRPQPAQCQQQAVARCPGPSGACSFELETFPIPSAAERSCPGSTACAGSQRRSTGARRLLAPAPRTSADEVLGVGGRNVLVSPAQRRLS